MLEALRTLGGAYLDLAGSRQKSATPEEALLQTLTKTNEASRYDQLLHFYLRRDGQGRWFLLGPEAQDVEQEALFQALWVGHAPRSEIQDRATVANLNYLISQALPALAGLLTPGVPDPDLRHLLEQAVRGAFLELPIRKPGEKRYRWVWNLPALGWFQWEWVSRKRQQELETLGYAGKAAECSEAVLAYAAQYGAKKTVQLLADAFAIGLAQRADAKGGRYLYTLHVEDVWLPRAPAYHRYLYDYYLGGLFTKARKGRCYVCGQEALVTSETTRLWLKFYITDKPGFASGFRKANFYRNYALCKACYQEILAGEAFLRTRLRSWLGAEVYVLPVFYLEDVQPSGANLEHWAGYVVRRWEASRTWEGWKNFRARLDEYREFENQKAWFLLDFLFVEDDGRSIKLQQYIQDVPPSRLDRLDEARYQTSAFANDYFVDSRSWDLSLSTLYYLFPIGKKGQGKQAFFQFLSALLHERPVDFRSLIPLFLETASVYRFQKYGAYIQRPPQGDDPQRHEKALCYFLAQTQLVRYDLFHLGLFSPLGGMPMSEMMFADEVRRLVPPKVWDYMDALGLDVPQRALFLLGYLVGEVALAQQKTGSVPILNKIHFQGMDEGKVRRLSNEILDQMRIYRVLYPDTRDLFAAMRALMDQAQRLLSPAENTYWVLSGYAFRYLRRFGASAPSKIEQETDQ